MNAFSTLNISDCEIIIALVVNNRSFPFLIILTNPNFLFFFFFYFTVLRSFLHLYFSIDIMDLVFIFVLFKFLLIFRLDMYYNSITL